MYGNANLGTYFTLRLLAAQYLPKLATRLSFQVADGPAGKTCMTKVWDIALK